MNNLNKLDLNISQNQNVSANSIQVQHKKISYIQDVELRFRQIDEDNNKLNNHIKELLNSKLEDAQQLSQHNTQIKCTLKMLNFSRIKIDQCSEALGKLCKHENLLVDLFNKNEETRINAERKAENVAVKCKTSFNILCSNLEASIAKQNQFVKENSDLKLKLNETTEENIHLKEIINNHNSDLERIKAEWTEQNSKLKYEKESIEMEYRTLTENYNNKENQNRVITEELNNAKQTICNLENIIKENLNELKTKDELIESLKKDINVLSEEVKSSNDKIENISDCLTETKEELVIKTESFFILENEKLNLQKEIEMLNNKIDDLNQLKLLDKQNTKKKENDFDLREQLLKEEQNRLTIRLNSRHNQHKSKIQPQVINDWDTNTSQSDITERFEKRPNLFSLPSKYLTLPSKRSAGKAGFRWTSLQDTKHIKYNKTENNLQNTQVGKVGTPEEIVTSSCK